MESISTMTTLISLQPRQIMRTAAKHPSSPAGEQSFVFLSACDVNFASELHLVQSKVYTATCKKCPSHVFMYQLLRRVEQLTACLQVSRQLCSSVGQDLMMLVIVILIIKQQ